MEGMVGRDIRKVNFFWNLLLLWNVEKLGKVLGKGIKISKINYCNGRYDF